MRLASLLLIAAAGGFAQSPNELLRRGMERFQAGQVEASLQDFDRVIALDKQAGPHLWQRGIALYMVGRFKDCKAQFEQHRSVNPEDVENSAWHFLCTARAESPAAARKILIPTTSDARPPMMTVQKLFAGKATPEDVMRDAHDETARFFGNLYIGLYYEANGEMAKATPWLKKAAEAPDTDYMRSVARVHWARLQNKK